MWLKVGNKWVQIAHLFESDFHLKLIPQDIKNLVRTASKILKAVANEGRNIGAESTVAYFNKKLGTNLTKEEIWAVTQKVGILVDGSNDEVEGFMGGERLQCGEGATILVHAMSQEKYSPLSVSGASSHVQQEQSSSLNPSQTGLESELVASVRAEQSGSTNIMPRQISDSQEPSAWPKSTSLSQITATTAPSSRDSSQTQSLESENRSTHTGGVSLLVTPRSESMEIAYPLVAKYQSTISVPSISQESSFLSAGDAPEKVVEVNVEINATIDNEHAKQVADDAAAEGMRLDTKSATANLACLSRPNKDLCGEAEDWESQSDDGTLAGPKSTSASQDMAMTAPSYHGQGYWCPDHSGSLTSQSNQNNDEYEEVLEPVRRQLEPQLDANDNTAGQSQIFNSVDPLSRSESTSASQSTVMTAPSSQRQGKGSLLGAKLRDEEGMRGLQDSENQSIGSRDQSLLVSPDLCVQDSPAAKVDIETCNLLHQLDANEVVPAARSKSTSASQSTAMAAPLSQRQGKGSLLGAKLRDEDMRERQRQDSEKSIGSRDQSLLVSPELRVQNSSTAKANKDLLKEIRSKRRANSFQRNQRSTRGVEIPKLVKEDVMLQNREKALQKLVKEDEMLQKREKALKKQLDGSQNTRRPLADIKNRQNNGRRRNVQADKPSKKKNIKWVN